MRSGRRSRRPGAPPADRGGSGGRAVRRCGARLRPARPAVGGRRALDGDPRDGSVRPRAGRADPGRRAGGGAGRDRRRARTGRAWRCSRPTAGCGRPTCCRTAGTRPATAWPRSSRGRWTPTRLVLVKPVGRDAAPELADPCFRSVLPAGLPWAAIGWQRIGGAGGGCCGSSRSGGPGSEGRRVLQPADRSRGGRLSRQELGADARPAPGRLNR